MAQIILGVVVIILGGALLIIDLRSTRRSLNELERWIAALREVIDRKPDLDDLKGQESALREAAEAGFAKFREEMAGTRAGLQRIQEELRDNNADHEQTGEQLEARLTSLESRICDEYQQLSQKIDTAANSLLDQIKASEQHSRAAELDVRAKLDVLSRDLRNETSGLSSRQRAYDQRLLLLESATWAAVRGELYCPDPDIGVAVEDVLLRFAAAAGLHLTSTRVLRRAPLSVRYWFSGTDGTELADWFRHAVAINRPEAQAMREVLDPISSGTFNIGPMKLVHRSGGWDFSFVQLESADQQT